MKGKMSEADLLSALREGGEAREKAIKTFFIDDPTLQNKVKKFVLRQNGTEEDAQEVFYDTVIEFCKNVDKRIFQEQSSVQTYFIAISLNLWFLAYRKKRPTEPLPLQEIGPNDVDTDEEYLTDERLAMLDFGLEQLEERQREILKAKYQENMSMKQIAEAFDLSSEGMAKKYIDRFRKYLLEHIKKHPAYSKTTKKG